MLGTKRLGGGGGGNVGCFSRRNKCLVVTLTLTIAALVMLMNAGLFAAPPVYTGSLCKLEDIKLQKNFDKKKFSGSWYAAFTKGSSNPFLASLLEFSDVKVNFVIKDDNSYDVKSVGGKFLGMWCPPGEGHMESRDPEHPQRMSVFFDTPTGKKFGTKPTWLLGTDYTSYAVIYSCWEQTDDGECKSTAAYAGVITRTKDPISDSTMGTINGILSGACVNPQALKKVKHEGYCKKEQEVISQS